MEKIWHNIDIKQKGMMKQTAKDTNWYIRIGDTELTDKKYK